MKLRTSLVAAVLVARSLANTTFQVEFANLRDEHADPVSNGTLVLLIADSSGDLQLPGPAELQGADLSEGSTIAGDKVFFAGVTISDPLLSPVPDGGLFKGLANVDYLVVDVEAGDIWGVYWFPGLFSEGSVAETGQAYGTYQSSTIDPTTEAFGATSAMVFPTDAGTTETTFYYDAPTWTGLGITPDPDFTPTAGDFTAEFVVLPETSPAFFIGAAGVLLLLWRRRGVWAS